MKTKLLPVLALSLCACAASAATGDRVQIAQDLKAKYGITHADLDATDPDFVKIYDNLLYGDVLGKVELNDRYKGFAYITTLVSLGINDKLYEATIIALDLGVTPVELKDIVYQCAPYVGIEKVKSALPYINKALTDKGVKLPLPSTATTSEETRFAVGKQIQVDTYGPSFKQIHEQTPADEFYLQVYNLSSYCFGDFYSRSALAMPEREFITVLMIATLGGQEPQLRSHIPTALKIGVSKQDLIGGLSIANPFIGYPRTLTALGIVREESAKLSAK